MGPFSTKTKLDGTDHYTKFVLDLGRYTQILVSSLFGVSTYEVYGVLSYPMIKTMVRRPVEDTRYQWI